MAFLQPPSFLQNRSDHTAAGDRLTTGSIVSSGGVVGVGDLEITQQASPNMTVRVAPGKCFVAGTLNNYQGMYHCVNDAVVNITIAASSASFPRRDLIVARVYDAFYAGASNQWAVEVVTGVATSTPALPVVPANSIVLAEILVPASSSTVINANILNRRPKARTRLLVEPESFTSATRPAGFTGQIAYETDTKKVVYYDGTAWVYLALPTYDTGRRNVSAVWLNGGVAAWGGSVQVQRYGEIVHLTGYLTVNTGSAFIGLNRDGTSPVSIPEGWRPIYKAYPIGLGTAMTSGGSCDVVWDQTVNRIKLSGASATWSVGNYLSFALTWNTNEAEPSPLPGVAA